MKICSKGHKYSEYYFTCPICATERELKRRLRNRERNSTSQEEVW